MCVPHIRNTLQERNISEFGGKIICLEAIMQKMAKQSGSKKLHCL